MKRNQHLISQHWQSRDGFRKGHQCFKKKTEKICKSYYKITAQYNENKAIIKRQKGVFCQVGWKVMCNNDNTCVKGRPCMLESLRTTMSYRSVFFGALSGSIVCASTGQYARRSRRRFQARMPARFLQTRIFTRSTHCLTFRWQRTQGLPLAVYLIFHVHADGLSIIFCVDRTSTSFI